MDRYLRFVNGVQAMRRRVSALDIGLCGALGVAAIPLPHQIATVRRILGDTHIRHLISDEVGLGKTVQALMIVNALRWQHAGHRTLVIAPDNLLSQWQEECWIRGHVMPAIAGTVGGGAQDELSPVTLARPYDLMTRPEQEERTISANPDDFDLLIVDEPQTMPREAMQYISQSSDGFRQVLVLSATPKLGDPAWRELILRMIEPEAAALARMEERNIDNVLKDREEAAIAVLNASEDQDWTQGFLQSGAARRIIRNGRSDWKKYLPERCNHVVRLQPLMPERLRHEIAAKLLEDADPGCGIQAPAWTAARALQRSARAARRVLTDLETQGGDLGKLAETVRLKSLEDPGDSRLEALLDILSEQWSLDKDRAFIIVCGDVPTIDMLYTALPRYFPFLADGITDLRQVATTDVEGAASLRKIQDTLAPLLSRKKRLLLVGDRVQAGLNLHHIAHGIIFFSVPWEIDGIDQLIGRVDRLGAKSGPKSAKRNVDIWRILVEGSQDTAVADTVAALGVFDAPLPPLSPSEFDQVQTTLGQAAINRKVPLSVAPIASDSSGIFSRFKKADPYTPQKAATTYKQWRKKPCPEPAMMSEIAYPKDSPIKREERAIGGWLKTIQASHDFDTQPRIDKDNGYRFQTFWYHRAGEKDIANESPFDLPDVSRENWMSGHIPFIYQRKDISAPPRKNVLTDEKERSADSKKSGRPLRFFDHGAELHDALVAGFAAKTLDDFGKKTVLQTVVTLPDGHPAQVIGGPVLISVAQIDPFPDERLPPLWTPEARRILEAAPTDVQRRTLTADRHALQTLFRALQRNVRISAPAKFIRIGSKMTRDGWQDLAEEEVDFCLKPITSSLGNTPAKGKSTTKDILSHKAVIECRNDHMNTMAKQVNRYRTSAMKQIPLSLANFVKQADAHFRAEVSNRKRALDRRRQAPAEAGPTELRRGQVEALERSLAIAKLNFSEALAFLKNVSSGNVTFQDIRPSTILMAFIANG